ARRRAAEAKAVPGSTTVAEAAARNLFRLMAHKDEYEVARLYTDGSFERDLARQFQSWKRLEFHMAPPILGRRDPDGRAKKASFGPWMMTALRLLAALRGLRGTILDPFGHTAERRRERELLAQYESDLDSIERALAPGRIEAAAALASVPALVRGYGHLRLAAMEKASSERARLLRRLADHLAEPTLRADESVGGRPPVLPFRPNSFPLHRLAPCNASSKPFLRGLWHEKGFSRPAQYASKQQGRHRRRRLRWFRAVVVQRSRNSADRCYLSRPHRRSGLFYIGRARLSRPRGRHVCRRPLPLLRHPEGPALRKFLHGRTRQEMGTLLPFWRLPAGLLNGPVRLCQHLPEAGCVRRERGYCRYHGLYRHHRRAQLRFQDHGCGTGGFGDAADRDRSDAEGRHQQRGVGLLCRPVHLHHHPHGEPRANGALQRHLATQDFGQPRTTLQPRPQHHVARPGHARFRRQGDRRQCGGRT